MNNLNMVIISESKKWEDAEKTLSKEQIELISRFVFLHSELKKSGVNYNLNSKSLPTVEKPKATDQILNVKPSLSFPIYMENSDRWNYAKEKLSEEVFLKLEEFFNIFEELKVQNLEYVVTPADSACVKFPLKKEGLETNNIVLF